MLRKINLNRILLNLTLEKPIGCPEDFKTHLNIILDLTSIFKCFFVDIIRCYFDYNFKLNCTDICSIFGLVLANEITLFTVHALIPGVFLIFVCFYFTHNCGNLSILPIIWCFVSFQFIADCVFSPTLVTRRVHFP